jgi:S-DNA-T family DNA segregation ATPase FtsK/SpoIIIE
VARYWKLWIPVSVFAAVSGVVGYCTGSASLGLACGAFAAFWVGWRIVEARWVPLAHRRVHQAFLDTRIVTNDDDPVKVLAKRDHPTGQEIDVAVPKGRGHSEIAAKAEHLAHALRAEAVEVFSLSPGVVTLRLRTKADPLAGGAGTWPLLAEPGGGASGQRSFEEPIPVGINESGQVATLALYSSSVLVGGVPGSGKSVGVEELLYGAALCPEVCLMVVDLKGGMELSAIADAGRADYFIEDRAALAPLLRRLMAEVVRRQKAVRATPRLRKVEPNMWGEFPPLVLIIDELAEATASGDRDADREVNDLLRRLVALGRSCGLSVVASTQRPSSDLVPTSFRDLFRHRWGFRTSTAAMSAITMGESNRDHSQGPHDIPDGMPGVSFIGNEEGQRQRVRTFYITDDEIEVLALRAAHAHVRSGWTFELPPDPVKSDTSGDGSTTPKRTRRPRSNER